MCRITMKRRLASLLLAMSITAGLLPLMPAAQAADASVNSTVPSDVEEWDKLVIPYDYEADENGYQGTPLGNGYFGVRQSGGVNQDVFQLNHKGFWSGDPQYVEEISNGGGTYGTTAEERLAAYENTREWD